MATANIKGVIQEIAAKVQADFDAMTARLEADAQAHPEWGAVLLTAEDAAKKAEAMVMEQVTLLVGGDASVVIAALAADVTPLLRTGHSRVADAVSKADLA